MLISLSKLVGFALLTKGWLYSSFAAQDSYNEEELSLNLLEWSRNYTRLIAFMLSSYSNYRICLRCPCRLTGNRAPSSLLCQPSSIIVLAQLRIIRRLKPSYDRTDPSAQHVRCLHRPFWGSDSEPRWLSGQQTTRHIGNDGVCVPVIKPSVAVLLDVFFPPWSSVVCPLRYELYQSYQSVEEADYARQSGVLDWDQASKIDMLSCLEQIIDMFTGSNVLLASLTGLLLGRLFKSFNLKLVLCNILLPNRNGLFNVFKQ